MDILVCVKRVPLTAGKMVLTADERAIETRHLGSTIRRRSASRCWTSP